MSNRIQQPFQGSGIHPIRPGHEDIVNSDLDLDTKKTVLLRAEMFAGLVYEQEIIDLIFREVEKMFNIEESAGYQRIYEKGLKKGIEQGMEKGMEKGNAVPRTHMRTWAAPWPGIYGHR
ncbi:hypothetical protein SY88_09595 [Clostridiales bacterium PH28_bin88]|nr:hypothetical protein SY88_09595 [Clostridiales bacterium PH28_bin88]